MTAVMTETAIANRALQRVGAQRIGEINSGDTLWTEDSKNASEIRACYHMLRRSELRRNVWRTSTRRVALRAIATTTKVVAFGLWASGSTYALNDVVTGSDGQIYQSRVASNTAHDPTDPANYAYWSLYFNVLTVTEFVTTWDSSITYAKGDHSVGSDGVVYVSLSANNTNHDPTTDGGVHWGVASAQTPTDNTQATNTSFYAGELVYTGAKLYLSLQNSNTDVPSGSSKWMTMTTAPTLSLPNIIYPLGSGPIGDSTTRNIYQLPNGFLREAPQMPKQGSVLPLGAPAALGYTDWEYSDNYIVTIQSNVIVFRFCADLQDPMTFDAMFCEGLASRIAFEICEPLTQSTAKLQSIAGEYKQFMSEARTVNGIEEGPTEPPEDDYIECRR